MTASDELRRAIEPLARDLGGIFGPRLRSVVAYGGHEGGVAPDGSREVAPGPDVHTLVLVDGLTPGDLTACAQRVPGWRRQHLATPLLLTPTEFARSLDAFPLEYGEIIAHHLAIIGDDPFEHVTVAPEDLRRACEVQVKSHLLHLREGYLESGAGPAAVASLVAASARPFEALLRSIAHLQGFHAETREDLARHAEHAIGLAAPVVGRVIGVLHANDLPPADAVRLLPAYLEAVERLADYVDRWNAAR